MKKEAKEKINSLGGIEHLIKKYGKVISSGLEVFEKKKGLKTLSVSPNFDIALNGGILEGTWTVVMGAPKIGKAQPVDSTVYTPSGPRRIGDLKVGDVVLTPDGSQAVINGVYPQGFVETYRILFNDGSSTLCCGSHLWKVKKNDRKKEQEHIKSTIDLVNDLRFRDRFKWSVQMTEPVSFEKRELEIDPYILGMLLGDGGLTQKTIMYTSTDQQLLDSLSEYIVKHDCVLKHAAKISYRIKTNGQRNAIKAILVKYGLHGCGSHTKFIPVDYKYSSIEDRYAIIQGLMDTDGCATDQKIIEYSTVSKRLSEDVKEICQSLGYMVRVKERFTKCNGKSFHSYRLTIHGDGLSRLFRLERKKSLCTPRTKKKLSRKIVEITKVDNMDSVCISLNNSDHLYLTNDFIVTHNTTVCLQVCANAQKEGRNVIYLDGENRLKNYNLVGVKDLDLSKIQIIHSSQDGEKLSAEDYLTILEQMMQLQENIGAVVVVDSTSSLLPRAELDSEVSGTMRANMPKLLAHWIRKNAQTITKQKIIILVITHHITNTSGYGKHKLPDGGLYLQYQADTLIEFKSAEPWMDGVEKVGQIAECDIICSSMGSSGKKCQTYLRYGLGIDKVQESITLAVELGLIDKSGTWMYLVYLDGEVEDYDHDSFKAQGSAKLYEMIASNPQYLEILLRKLKEML